MMQFEQIVCQTEQHPFDLDFNGTSQHESTEPHAFDDTDDTVDDVDDEDFTVEVDEDVDDDDDDDYDHLHRRKWSQLDDDWDTMDDVM